MGEPVSGDMTVARAIKDGRHADIAVRVKLSISQVKTRLNQASGNAILRTVFHDSWDGDAIGHIGQRRAASARDEKFIALLAWALQINPYEVQKLVSMAAGNTLIATVLAENWPQDGTREQANRFVRDYIGNQPLGWIQAQDLVALIDHITDLPKRSILSILKAHTPETRVIDAFVPWPGAPGKSQLAPPPPPNGVEAFVPSESRRPGNPQPVDLGIIVALPEELREFLDLAGPCASYPDPNLDAFRFTRGLYNCALIPVGEMGESQAGMFTERLISAFDPSIILSVGIAGGIHDDLSIGDVHVPTQAAQYMQDAKASSKAGGGFIIIPGAPAYRADYHLLKAARGFEFHHAAEHKKWQEECAADYTRLLTDTSKRNSLITKELVRAKLKLLADGHVATGPVVGASAAFSTWIRATCDRNVKSLEMESAAVLLAAQTRHEPKRALAIRGISDYGDKRKQALDKIGAGSLRRYAMRNAVRFLWALLDAKVLPRNTRVVSENPTARPS